MYRVLYKIAKAELQMLFYSPVAWLLLVVFVIQSGMVFSDMVGGLVSMQEMGYGATNLSLRIFGGQKGIFTTMLGHLYFYIPLLTMGVVSRELSSGSIKLLYSSPITNFQIIVGKYFSIMIYGLLMIGILLLLTLIGIFIIKDFDLPAILTGLLGVYLLLCAYGAIGIFMSSLTSYQIVAAIGTLIVLMLLNMVGNWGQDYDFIRDITYWLSINGRSSTFLNGMICSEDVLYFIIVVCLFLSLTIIRLNAVRQKIKFSITLGRNLGVILVSCLLGYFSSLPIFKFYHDSTATNVNTLTQNSQGIVSKLKGGLTITSYINVLEQPWFAKGYFIKQDEERFERYTRFKPEIKLKYVYYYDSVYNPQLDEQFPNTTLREKLIEVCKSYSLDTNKFLRPEEIRSQVDLSGEGNRFVRVLERESGEKTWLRIYNDMMRFPSEREISAALKRLVMNLPVVGFVTGHGERGAIGNRDVDYRLFASEKTFRHALLNQGFDTRVLSLTKPIPEDVDILVIADPRQEFNDIENRNIDTYIAQGGNVFLLVEPKREEIANMLLGKFGFEMQKGTLVKQDTLRRVDVLAAYPTKDAEKIAYDFGDMRASGYVISMAGCGGIVQKESDLDFNVIDLFKTDSQGCWNELETTDFVDDTIQLNTKIGEVERSYSTIVALSRSINGKEQKVILTGDADCISNLGIEGHRGMRASNYSLITGGFFWMSNNEVPIDVRRPAIPDDKVLLGMDGVSILKWLFIILLPLFLIAGGLFTWIRRKGR